MIKAIIFDYGGVMTDGGAGPESSVRLARHLHITRPEAHALIQLGWHEFMKNDISEDEFWQTIETHFGRPISQADRNIWNTWESMKPRPEMVALVRRLKTDGFTVGLLSNSISPTSSKIRQHGGYEVFDFTVISYEVHMAKPDPEIYEFTLSKLPGIEASETIFIDDQEKCLKPARQFGIHTILAKNPQQIATGIDTIIRKFA